MYFLASDTGEIAVMGGLFIAVLSIILSMVRRIMMARAQEESRREIAAYVAEGSISADDAKKLLDAGKSMGDSCRT